MATTTASIFVDTTEQLKTLLDKLVDLDRSIPQIFIDLEGHNISSGGALSVLQLLFLRERQVYLIDLCVLGKDAFTTPGSSGTTLHSILESSDQAKAIFDVRADSHALHRHYGIKLAGVQDIQLMELATRSRATKCVNGLAKCIEYDVKLNPRQRQSWVSSKEAGKKMFDPTYGGSYAIFDERPLPEAVKTYCVQDVLLLPALWLEYSRRLNSAWNDRIDAETRCRIDDSQKPTFKNGRHMALGPSGWMSIRRDLRITGSREVPDDFVAGCEALLDQLQSVQPVLRPGSGPTGEPSTATNDIVERLTAGLSEQLSITTATPS